MEMWYTGESMVVCRTLKRNEVNASCGLLGG